MENFISCAANGSSKRRLKAGSESEVTKWRLRYGDFIKIHFDFNR